MNKAIKYFAAVVFATFLFGFLQSSNVSAKFVDGMTLNSHDTWTNCTSYNTDGSCATSLTYTIFNISVTWGSDCEGHCETVSGTFGGKSGVFWCTKSGSKEMTKIKDWGRDSGAILGDKDSAKYSNYSTAEGWDYYTINVNPDSSDEQTASGVIRKKQKRTLTGEAINLSGHSISDIDDVSSTTWYGEDATVTRRTKSGYTFLGWRATKAATSNVGSLNHDASITKNLTSDQTVYAVYAPDYKLTIEQDHATAKVERTGSPYAGASNGTLSNGATIYYGDVLNVTYAKNDCFNWDKHTVKVGSGDATSRSSGYSWTVTGNTKVVAKAYVREWTLTMNPATGTSIAVKRTQSPYTSSGAGALSSGATIYCGDKLNTTFNLNAGYSWGNYDWSDRRSNHYGYEFSSNGENGIYSSFDFTGPTTAENNDHSVTSHTETGFTVDNNATAQTWAVRNSFQARARVQAGNSVNSSATSTGYVNNNTSNKSISIECKNKEDGGCNASYDLYIKTTAGTGATKYQTGVANDGGGTSWTPNNRNNGSTHQSSTATKAGGGTYTLSPGHSKCNSIEFKPYGSFGNDDWLSAVTACAEAKITYFQGKVSVLNGSDTTLGYTEWSNGSAPKKNVYIENCSPTDGCKVSFKHEMQRTSTTALGSSAWSVSLTSNLRDTGKFSKAIPNNDSVGSGKFNSNSATVKEDGTYTLYPGMIVCETLTFKPNNKDPVSSVADVSVTACASALGKAQPDDSAAHTFIDINVKNESVTKYNSYRKEVYAKPGDKVSYQASYEPLLQYTAFLEPERMKIDDGTVHTNGRTATLQNLFNDKWDKEDWNNAFSIYKSNTFKSDTNELSYCNASACLNPSPGQKSDYNVGNRSKKTPNANSHNVIKNSEVGVTLTETAATNHNSSVSTTPGQVTFTNPSGTDYNLADVSTAARSKSADVRVPYNYKTSTEVISTEASGTILYAGEQKDINYIYNINPRENPETVNPGGQEYATKVGNPKWMLGICIGETECNNNSYRWTSEKSTKDKDGNYIAEEIAKFNVDDMYKGRNKEHSNAIQKTTTINVPDYPAGTRVCLKSAVYPANSGAYTNYNNPNGNNTWAYSAPTCYRLAKKPSIQVWGGNIYSDVSMETFTTTKHHVYSYNDYKIEGDYDKHYSFGSWGELGIISNGMITGLGSGTSLGYASTPAAFGNTNGAILKPAANASPGGNTKNDFCTHSPISFANNACGDLRKSGELGSPVIRDSTGGDIDEIVKQFAAVDSGYGTSDNGIINNPANLNGTVYYYHSSGNVSLPSFYTGTTSVNRKTIQVVRSDGRISINGDITYQDNYNSLEDVPKLVIYAEKGIDIDCNVARVDAILLTMGKVNTCSNASGVTPQTSPNASVLATRQLIINGTVLANGLDANRTYGAASGANSVVPAEIINYDPTLYQWGSYGNEGTNGEGSTDNNVNMDVVYQKELAPRY